MPAVSKADTLLRFRPEFPILAKTIYLISNSLGAMPRGAQAALNEYCEVWARRGVRAWEETWWDLGRIVGNEIGELFHAPPDSISVHQNVTQCEAVIASCLDFRGKRNKVVYTDMNFPSVMYFWEAQRARGARVQMVKTDDGISINTQRLLDAIDEETRIVPISHVLFRSAYIKDVAAITEKAHKVGALVMLDCFQSAGVVPFDIQQLNVDFATGAVLKWLCGGPGTAYLYVRPDHGKTLQPTLTGWAAHEKPFKFETGPTRYAEAPYRFMNGTPNVAALYAARPGVKLIKEAGIANIRAKSKRQTALIQRLAEERGWKVNTPGDPEKRGGTISVDMPNSREVCAELLKRDVVVDWRPNAGIRMAPHYYNTDEELAQAFTVADQILSDMKVTR